MESVIHSALEEICSQGANGLAIADLWPKLHSPLSSHGLPHCPNVKKALWANLTSIPGLRYEARGVSYSPHDPPIQSLLASEQLNVRIVAAEHLRNSFVGIYDIKASDAGVSQPQRRALERLAIARTNGITQSELAKEFGMKGNNIFYVLRNLECRGLIVRQSTIVRKKELGTEGESKNSSIVSTNMLHLYRYAKHLGSQQRLEIIKEDKGSAANENADGSILSSAGIAEECIKEDVHIKDYLPALKAICDKLEKADGKVLVVSDIKRDLGYRGTSGHRAWRNICHRLKDARLVEEFCAKVNKKEVSCLRLLKEFSSRNFEPKTVGCGYEDLDTDLALKSGKRGQITEQLVELPMEHQIYDMIDAEGSKGLTITEVCKRLGISNKRYYTRLLKMFSRFGMHLQAESHNRGVAYRVWTSRNFSSEVSNAGPEKLENLYNQSGDCRNVDVQETLAQTIQGTEHWTSEVDARSNGKDTDVAAEPVLPHGLPVEAECNEMLPLPSSSHNMVYELSGTGPGSERQIVSNTIESKFDSVEVSPCALSTPRRRRSYRKYPCLNLNAASQQRELRILEMLQAEKFLIKAELHRQLESLEKDKHTIMDRKTLERSLIKLQQEGHCKCIRVSVPVVTNCGRSRTMDVVLHPSFDNVSPELLGQIHDRLRSFEMQVRGQGSFRLKKGESVPVLNGVQRILKNVKSDAQAERSEAMRANGFVLAKMVRAKLLHVFLWGYISCLPGWDDALSTGKHGYDLKNPHSTCLSFELEAAIKAMPLELFLQVVGSTQKFEDMISKCRIGLRLSDLPINDYRNLMDTQATARLSYLVDILRRLKLIRIVSGEGKEDAGQRPHAALTYALELKPYIEEPVGMVVPSSGFINLDIRPQIRHDFVLSSRKAADEYWSTLEYCYAAADSKAALHAFPGSAVHEIFLFRSWASVRVMTAEQRAELLKRVVDDDPGKKLSFKECEKIAKDLNLTLEQVLRVYYDKGQKRLTRLQGVLCAKGEQFQPLKGTLASSSRKRKRSSEGRLLKDVNDLAVSSGDQRHDKSFEIGDQTTKEQSLFLTSSGEHHVDHMDGTEELGSKEEEDGHPFIRKCALSRLNSTRQRKFSWTEKADRQLLIEYARHRAALGAKYHRTDWASLSNLPAPPDTCKRRMALLNNSIQFRKALMRLCNVLTERYAKHLGEFHSKSSNNDSCRVMVRNYSPGQECNRSYSDVLEHTEEGWDDFNNKDIKVALDEVLQYKRRAKEEALVTVGSASEEHSVLSMDAEGRDSQETNIVSSAIPHEEVKNSTERSKVSIQRLSCHRVPRKYIELLNEGMGISRRAYESLAVSNAAELFKLVFLSTSTAPEVPNLLAETLRRYSEHDLFAAFNYLREKKIMVGGNGSSPFVLSQQFLQRISTSPFPINTGKRAAKFARWLHEKESELMEEGVDLTADLQCGDVFHLCALISSGELLISPRLPDQGVGEAEDSRSSKRKSDNDEFSGKDKGKKLKASLTGEGEIISRREKGFPGIKLSLSCAAIARGNEVECFKSQSIISASFPFNGTDQGDHTSGQYVGSGSSLPNQMEEASCSPSILPATVAASESPWEAMACYAEHLVSLPSNEKQSPFNPELFKNVCSAIQKAGDQGLSVEEICKVTNMMGENVPGLIIEVLEAFGRALKVNAYDSVHIVDSLYRSKYFLTPMAELCQDYKVDSTASSRKISYNEHLILQPETREDNGVNYQRDISINADEVHRVTILNLPEEVGQPLREIQSTNEDEGYVQARVMSPGRDQEGETFGLRSDDSNLCRPILPWINGDGSINDIVYKGLVRRVLGIVMQHPAILEYDILSQMQTLNPQSCRSLLELMILDNHIIRRKMHQATTGEPPVILGRLLRSNLKSLKAIYREHFFVNPMCTNLL